MKIEEKYLLNDVKLINITQKLKNKAKLEKEKFTDIITISVNMQNALNFIIKESKKGKNLKKVKSMLNIVIKELQLTVRDL